jgi:hypothetical protein
MIVYKMEIQNKFYCEEQEMKKEEWHKLSISYKSTCAWIRYRQTVHGYEALISGFFDVKGYEIARHYLTALNDLNQLRYTIGLPRLQFIDLINERRKHDESLGIQICLN